MKLKPFMLPILVVMVSLLWAFKPYEASKKVIRTKEGAYIIPSTVKIADSDKQRLLKALKEYKEPLGALAYYENGKMKTYGQYDLRTFRQVGKHYGTSMEPSQGVVMGVVLFKKKLVRSKTKDENKFSESTIFDEKAWVTLGGIQSIGTQVDAILGRYAD
ncbi:MAG: hypothetical protein AAF927_19000 [Bacteroidota bacterium]